MKDLKDYPKVPNAECILEKKYLHFISISFLNNWSV